MDLYYWSLHSLISTLRRGTGILIASKFIVSLPHLTCSQWTEEDEIADYERNSEWMDECMDGMFEKWFDKISQASPEDKRKVNPPQAHEQKRTCGDTVHFCWEEVFSLFAR